MGGGQVDADSTSTGGTFSRRLLGYSRREVDTHLDQGARAYQAACREIERLRAAEPLARVGGDVAALISSFADTVSTMRDAAKQEVDEVRKEADTYAAGTRQAADTYATTTRQAADTYATATRADADRQFEAATLRARAESSALLHAARAEIAGLVDQRQQVERSLREATDGIANAMRAINRVGGLAEPAMPRGPSPSGPSQGGPPAPPGARPERPMT